MDKKDTFSSEFFIINEIKKHSGSQTRKFAICTEDPLAQFEVQFHSLHTSRVQKMQLTFGYNGIMYCVI